MAIFNSCVKLPEGIGKMGQHGTFLLGYLVYKPKLEDPLLISPAFLANIPFYGSFRVRAIIQQKCLIQIKRKSNLESTKWKLRCFPTSHKTKISNYQHNTCGMFTSFPFRVMFRVSGWCSPTLQRRSPLESLVGWSISGRKTTKLTYCGWSL